MAETGSVPRPINLNLPSDYFSKPTTKLLDWLEQNIASLRMLSEGQIILKARSALGSDISVLNNDDLAAHIRSWARSHGFQLMGGPAGAASAGDPQILEDLKKFFGSIPTEVKWVMSPGSAAIDMSGLTATLDTGKTQIAITQGWDGGMGFKTTTSGMEFEATIGPKTWSMTFTIGRLAPDLMGLHSVFKKGESALRGVLGNLDKIDVRNPSKTKQAFSPYLDPIKYAIDQASKTFKQRPGDISFGAWAQSGVPGAPEAGGVSAGVQFTIVF